MYLEQSTTPRKEFYNYIIGTVLVFVGAIVGQIPFGIAATAAAISKGEAFPTEEDMLYGLMDSNLTFFLMLLSFAVALGTLFLVVKYFHKQSLVSLTTGRKKIDWRRIFFAFGLWSLISIVVILLSYFVNKEQYELNFKPVPFTILFIVATLLIPIQTSAEEYFFRGYLMQGLGSLTRNKWFPLFFTSIVFGLMHIANPEVQKIGMIIMVYYIGTGLFLGILTLMDDGLELALGFHAANNWVTALLVTSNWTAFQTESVFKDYSEPSMGFEIMLPVVVVYPVLLLVFAKIYQWNNWKERLFGKIVPITKHD
jgi:membrane protease YdiL (CAAX protease family)